MPCTECQKQQEAPFDFTMAFQPILDLSDNSFFAHEALVRGINNESAGSILARVNEDNRYWFDQQCRMRAIELAAELGINDRLSINFLPNAVYRAEACIRLTIETAERVGFPLDRIIFEVTEGEQVVDHAHLISIITAYKKFGFQTAIDDFGAGYSGLNLLAEFQPDIIKLDMALTRNIDSDRVRRSIVGGILTVCRDLEIDVIAEGIESHGELATLQDMGVQRFQGYLFARPVFRDFVREWPAFG